ncbi:MAG: hypothetical protein HYT31_01060 [Parcubacteria group bacterium]|nr:hypothetical protein [Parcubacteria group bacterium]
MEREVALHVYGENPDMHNERVKLREEIAELAFAVGADLSEDELRIAAEGAQPQSDTEEEHKEQGEAYEPFRLAERAARYGSRAQDAPEDSDERRIAGTRHLALLAAHYLRDWPELSRECLEYARDLRGRTREWREQDIPRPQPAAAQESMRRAA